MRRYVRNKLAFIGTPEELRFLVKELKADNGDPISFERIIPLSLKTEEEMEKEWGVPAEAEEIDFVLYRNETILEYSFDTIEKTPLPVFEKLVERYPGYSMNVQYAGEEYGENCGILVSLAGGSSLVFQPPEDPFEFACEIWGVDPEEERQERMINFYEE